MDVCLLFVFGAAQMRVASFGQQFFIPISRCYKGTIIIDLRKPEEEKSIICQQMRLWARYKNKQTFALSGSVLTLALNLISSSFLLPTFRLNYEDCEGEDDEEEGNPYYGSPLSEMAIRHE